MNLPAAGPFRLRHNWTDSTTKSVASRQAESSFRLTCTGGRPRRWRTAACRRPTWRLPCRRAAPVARNPGPLQQRNRRFRLFAPPASPRLFSTTSSNGLVKDAVNARQVSLLRASIRQVLRTCGYEVQQPQAGRGGQHHRARPRAHRQRRRLQPRTPHHLRVVAGVVTAAC